MTLDATLNVFRAIGEETRLRIMVLLERGELTVSELTQILGQSQPRVSRHLKILADGGLVERHREGSWMFYRAARGGDNRTDALRRAMADLAASDDRVIARDRDRFLQSREARARQAAAYFERNASEWDTVRRLHLPETDIEAAMRTLVGPDRVALFVDLGSGTGRMLEVFADCFQSGVGFDISREMLAVARANLERAGVQHAQVRHGNLFSAPLESGTADLVCLHQVLHYLAEPELAVREAARLLKPGGRLLIVDFAPHELEFLRHDHAHRRLGFSDDEVKGWRLEAGLDLVAAETLSPRSGDREKLTVKLWLCGRPEAIRRLKTRAA
jgi:ArsR family transcriptional regulator